MNRVYFVRRRSIESAPPKKCRACVERNVEAVSTKAAQDGLQGPGQARLEAVRRPPTAQRQHPHSAEDRAHRTKQVPRTHWGSRLSIVHSMLISRNRPTPPPRVPTVPIGAAFPTPGRADQSNLARVVVYSLRDFCYPCLCPSYDSLPFMFWRCFYLIVSAPLRSLFPLLLSVLGFFPPYLSCLGLPFSFASICLPTSTYMLTGALYSSTRARTPFSYTHDCLSPPLPHTILIRTHNSLPSSLTRRTTYLSSELLVFSYCSCFSSCICLVVSVLYS